MQSLLQSFSRFFESSNSPEPVHFHAGEHGHPFVCHDGRCGSPRLALSDAREFSHMR